MNDLANETTSFSIQTTLIRLIYIGGHCNRRVSMTSIIKPPLALLRSL